MPAARFFLLRGWALLTALAAAASLLLQFALLMRDVGASLSLGVASLRFFSYFTILSNLAVCLGCAWLCSGRALRPTVAATLALCIGVTGMIYLLALQGLWQPTGLQWWADVGLHYVVPLLYLAGWTGLLPHGGLRWHALGAVLLVPLGYLAWAMLTTSWLGSAPYPFLDVQQIGARAFGLNVLRVGGVFVLGWTLLWAMDGWRRR